MLQFPAIALQALFALVLASSPASPVAAHTEGLADAEPAAVQVEVEAAPLAQPEVDAPAAVSKDDSDECQQLCEDLKKNCELADHFNDWVNTYFDQISELLLAGANPQSQEVQDLIHQMNRAADLRDAFLAAKAEIQEKIEKLGCNCDGEQ